MIGFLRGKIFETHDEGLILDVDGVGYDVTCSGNTLGEVMGQESVALHVHTAVREDAITLFGFSTALEKRVFLSLLKVNGVGPKMAIKILSGASMERLVEMIETGDVRGLSQLPKVGKKTAEQLILSLKGQLILTENETRATKKPSVIGMSQSRFSGARADVLSALVNLGFRLADAERVVGELPEEVDVQSGVRKTLQALSGGF